MDKGYSPMDKGVPPMDKRREPPEGDSLIWRGVPGARKPELLVWGSGIALMVPLRRAA